MKNSNFKKYLKISGYFLSGVFALILIISIGAKLYFESNKTEMIQKLNTVINDNIDGQIHIGDIDVKILVGFPNFTLALNDVEIKDKFWEKHKRTFLKAGEIQVRVSLIGILRKQISIRKIVIKDAKIDAYVDANGISNSNIFKPSPKKKDSESDISAKLGEILLENVAFVSENRQKKKLFHFEAISVKSNFNHDNNENWQTKLKVKVLAKSMAFNYERGSFIKNQLIEGVIKASYFNDKKKIDVVANDLEIGKDSFDISAYFNVAKDNSLFGLDIRTNILWGNASALLANNISSKLNKFNLQKPLKTRCTIIGDMNSEGDPEIIVNADIVDDELNIPDGLIQKCSFHGKFTNEYEKGKGYTDANSAIVLTNLSGAYENVPFSIPIISINNLDNPIGAGKVRSDFKLTDLKSLVNDKIISFQKGDASVNLDFKVDIVDLKLHKPYYTGKITVKDASFVYEPKNVKVEDTDVLLDFTPERLNVEKIRIQNDKNIINVNFTIDNYLNLYYKDPSKILINCNVYSPYIDMKQMLGVFVSPKRKVVFKKDSKNASVKLFSILDKCQVKLNIKADKIKYKSLMGSDANAVVNYKNNMLSISDGRVSSFDGLMTFSGMLTPVNNNFEMTSKVSVNKVNISKFLSGFDNFGIKSFSPQNIKGTLSLKSDMKSKITSKGELVGNSLRGNVELSVNNGSLQNFGPMKNIGKFVPNRDLNNIVLHELESKLDAENGVVNVDKFRLSTSIINMDLNGIYSFERNTNLKVTIPLRNPKDDFKIKDLHEREKLRYSGTVLRLKAVDVDGKVKLKLG